jgi:CubicO group peptidase (beta-lactamase class C family)
MSDIQDRVQETIDDLVASGAEQGLQVAVYADGELVVDAVAGIADPATGRAVTSDTPFFSYSIGKGVAATAVHVLAEQGVVDYETPIAEVWPEFAAHGKSAITLRHALSQSAGVPGLPQDITIDDLPDWEKMCAVVADETPWWEAGTKIGYHAITWGFLVGEFVRRVTGKKISQIAREQVAAPLGIERELMLAVPAADLDRLAVNEDAPVAQGQGDGQDWAMPPDSPMMRIGPWEATSAAYGNRADVRQADIPAGGTVTARGVARMYAALLGPVDGVRLISRERLERVSAVAASGEDQVFGFPSAWGLGYSLGQSQSNAHETQHVFGVGGAGGSNAYADRRTGTTFALTKNRLRQDFAAAEAVAAVVADAR